jgi:hypothetical protein
VLLARRFPTWFFILIQGNHPISLIARNSVKNGIELGPRSGGVSKKKSVTKRDSVKALSMEILRMAGAMPSEIKYRREAADAKVQVNAEVSIC